MHQKLLDMLRASDINYRLLEHAPAETSADAARIRCSELRQGAKALILRNGDGEFLLFVVSAANELDNKKLRKALGCKKLNMANPQEVYDRFGLVKGSVPPFGSVFGLKVCFFLSIDSTSILGLIVFLLHTRRMQMFQ